ncbi:MAG: hypothetical protein JWM11_3953 [Planctomycetaceae bacterium]|nr:hypothetical protein [Planctomycetaceae bacterium]
MFPNTPDRIEQIRNIDELRVFIREMLCAKENLVSEQFPINEIVLRRGEQSCGLQFLLFGPRSIRLGAIWAAEHNVVYFYAANGERYLKVSLKHRLADNTASVATSS